MQIRNSADWRDALPFEIPVLAAEAVPGDPSKCYRCPADAAPLPRSELWVVKHRHPTNPSGFVRMYCLEHRPRPVAPPAPPATKARRASGSARAPRTTAPRKPSIPERQAALCPNCFVEVPPAGVCGMCGERVA
ncbi:hypothetical protein GCM10009808_16940 [Microbacterium sediminicola]|uniref:Glucose-6-phosphate dehydrogenase n=1 Tax=Microbacterium sediminicola TaxID=415210 RepID=A0ABP4U862_9MICO